MPSGREVVRKSCRICRLHCAAVMLIPGKSGTEAVETMLCEATQSCEKKTVTLPDGTKVFMNALSTLTYGDGFGITNRNISMTGEAYFVLRRIKPCHSYLPHRRADHRSRNPFLRLFICQTEDIQCCA